MKRRHLPLLISFAFSGFALLFLAACRQSGPAPATAPQFGPNEIKALEKAADAGDPVEKYKLGRKYRDGDTVPLNLTNAAIWFRKSAETGYAKAQYHLGLACEAGQGVPRDMAEAVKWYTRAADQDNSNAQEKLGFLYWKGEGVAKNLVEAYKWLTLAARNGEGKAAKNLKKLEVSMTAKQVTEAKDLAAAFTPKKVFKKPLKEN